MKQSERRTDHLVAHKSEPRRGHGVRRVQADGAPGTVVSRHVVVREREVREEGTEDGGGGGCGLDVDGPALTIKAVHRVTSRVVAGESGVGDCGLRRKKCGEGEAT